MKRENTKSPKKGSPVEEEDRWINVHDDDVMREMGFFRPFNQASRDESVWTKTPYERRILKKMRHSCKSGDMHFHSVPKKVMRVRCKLVINLFKNKRFSKTTYSTECWQHEIPEILAKYHVTDRKTGYSTSIVRKYSWNGKIYNPSDLPFWG